jgi:hypothetical protein
MSKKTNVSEQAVLPGDLKYGHMRFAAMYDKTVKSQERSVRELTAKVTYIEVRRKMSNVCCVVVHNLGSGSHCKRLS